MFLTDIEIAEKDLVCDLTSSRVLQILNSLFNGFERSLALSSEFFTDQSETEMSKYMRTQKNKRQRLNPAVLHILEIVIFAWLYTVCVHHALELDIKRGKPLDIAGLVQLKKRPVHARNLLNMRDGLQRLNALKNFIN